MKKTTSAQNTEIHPSIQLPGRQANVWLKIILALSYAFLMILIIQSITSPPQIFFDTSDYLRQSQMNPWRLEFYFYPIEKIQDFYNPIYPRFFRPFIYPLILTLVKAIFTDHSLYITTLLQKIFYIASTLIFSAILANFLNGKKYVLAFFILLLTFFISPMWSQWTASILTESFTLSFYLLLMSCLLLQFHRSYHHWSLKVATLLLMFLFAGIRDIDLYMLATTSLLLLAIGFISKDTKRKNLSLFYLLGAMLIISVCQLSIMVEHRQFATLADSIDNRATCQQDETLLKAYQQAGMPPQNLNSRFTGRDGFRPTIQIAQKHPVLYHWLLSKKSSHTYARYLLTHPYYSLIVPFSHALIEKEYHQCDRFRYNLDYASSIPQAFSPSLLLVRPYSDIPTNIMIILTKVIVVIPLLLFLLSLSISLFFKRSLVKNNPHLLVGLATMGSSLLVLLICWHGETQEVTRHSLIPVLQFYLACFYCSMALFNKYLAERHIN